MAMNNLGTPFNPGNILMSGPGQKPNQPFMNLQQKPQDMAGSATKTLGPEAVRATGQGPFDAAYRQNLATYGGGLFSRPGGMLGFNPTDPNALQGAQTGGGNAPIFGSPTGLLDQALGGNPFSFTQPPPQQPAQSSTSSPSNYWQFWLNQANNPYNKLRQTRNAY